MARRAGSLLGVAINGVQYDVSAESDVSWKLTDFSNEMIATSGKALWKRTKRVPVVENLDISCSFEEALELKAIADGSQIVTMGLIFAGGDRLSGSGIIEAEEFKSGTSSVSVTLLPEDGWTAIPG